MIKLNRRKLIAAGSGALAMPFVRPSWAASGRVNIYNWADYIGETTVEDFENEFGVSVVYDTYSSAEEMQAKMLAGSTGYDLVVTAGMEMPRANGAGLYLPLDKGRLSGLANLDPAIMQIVAAWDEDNAHSMPYMWGTVGFTFNLDMVEARLPGADLEDLATVFNPDNAAKLADCGISILDSPLDIMLTVMPWLGIDPQTAGPAEYERVAEAFAPIRPYIRTFDNSNYLNAIPNGELCVINNWSGDYGVAAGRAYEAGIEINLGYYVPKTGSPLWADVLAIPADAPNVDNAYLFLDYLLRPEVIAACTNYTWYANPNLAANEFVDPDILGDPAVYPDEEVISRLWAPLALTEEQDRAINQVWQRIKTGA